MNLQLSYSSSNTIQKEITISGSKSESNRLLILQQLFSNLTINNLSDSDDTRHLQNALQTDKKIIDIGHAGTAMRFLTAFFASQHKVSKILQGSERMHNRPIEVLVNALNDLGASINYLEKEGYPPLNIVGKKLTKNKITINGNISSQYISALMLIAPRLINGLEIELTGKITSIPYIKMTLQLLLQLSIKASFQKNIIKIAPKKEIEKKTITVEADWPSASYWYSFVALNNIGTKITLTAYKKNSLQGDSCLAVIYQHFNVSTINKDNSIILTKQEGNPIAPLNINLKNSPDIAQTITVTCFGLGIACNLTGLHTLKIKETDRLEALKTELNKLGATVKTTQESLHLEAATAITKNCSIATYNDHRMAMAFAPLAILVPIKILDANVVTKSYRNFWKDCNHVGIRIQQEK